MTWFVDASAIVAILGVEDDWSSMADRLDESGTRLWSPLSEWESSMALTKRLGLPLGRARELVGHFALMNEFQLVPIGEREGELAAEAALQYGKRSGHPARLNMGDCFAYACAKANNARLLYKGDDFAQTDLA